MLDFSSVTDRVKDLSGYKHLSGDDEIIEFVCPKELYGAIPEPIPANKVLPEWYKKLEGKLDKNRASDSSVKRCAPFMEAMTMGWIIPLAGEVNVESDEDSNVRFDWGFKKDLIDSHSPDQIGGDSFPLDDWSIYKFLNYWSIKAPDGYSAIITSPMNRQNQLFQTFSGVVDVDQYFNTINAPFLWTGGEWRGVLDVGTPLVQVIPFKRDSMITDANVRSMTEKEKMDQETTQTKITSHSSVYRDEMWVSKTGTRNIPSTEDIDSSDSACPFHR
jgi:hypothetical protein